MGGMAKREVVMGMLIKASCVIGVIALYSPVHETPVDTKGAFAAATAMGQSLGSLDAERAVKGVAMASKAAEALKSMPSDVRGRVLEGAASLVMSPAAPAPPKRAQP
jgi:hypothetical protein